MNKFFSVTFFLILLAGFISCRKDDPITDPAAKLSFSEDTVFFDTVFTTLASVTKRITIHNKNRKKINISSVRIAKGNNSKFRINIDGVPGAIHKNIEIEGRDSLYVFVEVTLDPNNINTPLIVADSIVFEANGNIQDVDLVAWGQDAYYHRPDKYIPGFPPFSIVNCNDIWQNDKPHVIYGYAVVDSACTLTIKQGTKIHFYNSAGLWIYRFGNLQVQGTKEEPVVFRGIRLEDRYGDEHGQWDRIWINESPFDSKIEYAIIENSFIGIQAESWQQLTINTLEINNTIIRNITSYGLFGIAYNIKGNNNIISNCGAYCAALTLGGSYNFKHSTFANYWTGETRKTPSVFINNFNSVQSVPLKEAYFGNCIIYGNLPTEMEFESKDSLFNFKFDHCIIKTEKDISDPSKFINIIKNPVLAGTPEPLFLDPFKNNYHLKAGSPAIDKGDLNIGQEIPLDLDGISRLPAPDIGALEFQP